MAQAEQTVIKVTPQMFIPKPTDECAISEASSDMATIQLEDKVVTKKLDLTDKRKLHNETVELRQ